MLGLNVNIQTGSTWVSLHQRRQQFINLVKPDRARGVQPFTLVYKGTDRGTGARPLYAKFAYAGGLDFGGIQSGFVDTPQVRCLATDPAWYEDNQEQKVLTPQIEVDNANHIIQNANGTWQALGTGTTGGTVLALEVGKDGMIYAGGAFSTAGGVANTIGIARWNGTTWQALGTGASTGTVYTLAAAPDGSVYAGGNFPIMGAVANTSQIAKWSGSVWSALATGVTTGTQVTDIVVDNDGYVYAGGYFIRIGGVAGTSNIGKWNGTTWSALDVGVNNQLGALCLLSDNSLLVGGNFTTAGSIAGTQSIAKWNGSAWQALNSGLTATFVYTIEKGNDDTIYIGGILTNVIGGGTINDAISWNGSAFSNLGSAAMAGASIRSSKFIDGHLYLTGDTTSVGTLTVPQGVVIWNGTSYVPIDVSFPGAPVVYSILADGQENKYFGFDTVGTAIASALTSIVPGATEAVYPTLIITGPTTAGTTAWVQRVQNRSTNETLYLNYMLQGGETLTLNFAPNKKTVVSDWRGKIPGQPLAGSDFSAFHLLPTTNVISTFILGRAGTTSGLSAVIQWTPTHWGIDGSA